MNTAIKSSIATADTKAQYDECAKRILGQKSILSRILIKTVDEFQGMTPKEVESRIEGEPIIGKVPINGGLTNRENIYNGSHIVGLNTENSEIHEGLIRFDIIFYVRMRDTLSKIIINVECQKDEPTKYDILNRSIFYVSRMISSQKGRDFEKTNYNDIRRVYSIWICMNMSECIWDYIHLIDEQLLGSHKWKGNLDIFNIVMIGLPKELPEKGKKYELHRLLTALLSTQLSVSDKLDIINDEYEIPTEDTFGEEMNIMCNLSQGILEEGIQYGISQGISQGEANKELEMILSMHQEGISIEKIAQIAKISVEHVSEIIKG